MPQQPGKKEVTLLLKELSAGKEGAEEALLPVIYNELRALARYFLRDERAAHTLQTTELVHEAYIRLCGSQQETSEGKTQYMRLAAQAMRRVLIDHARRKLSQKRGGRPRKTLLKPAMAIESEDTIDLLALDQALQNLSDLDPRLGQVVELRYFGGLTVEEIARVLDISPRTVKSDWKMAKAWLKRELS